jgi:predicted flap endonuclease-1-like 5' DNA nuclease
LKLIPHRLQFRLRDIRAQENSTMTNIAEIEGIGDKFAATLREHGIGTVEILLTDGGSPAGRKSIAEKTKIDAKRILEWVNRADLMRIKGVGSEYGDLLESAGVDTVKELATRRADNLQAKMSELNETKKIVRRAPSVSEVEKWIAEAKTLPPAVTY